MSVVSFIFSTNGLLICVLEGTKTNPKIKYKQKINLPSNNAPTYLVEWYETELNLILNREEPSAVNYKLTINNVTNSYVSKVFYGQAILNLLCSKKQISISHMSGSSLVPSKFGLAKGTNLESFIDDLLESQGPPWDSKMKETALMALTLLP